MGNSQLTNWVKWKMSCGIVLKPVSICLVEGHMGRGKRVERYLVTWFFAMSWLLEWQSSQVCVVLLVFGPPFAASHIIRLCCLSSVQVSESESKWWVLNQNADTRIKKPNAPCLLHSTEINLDWPYFLTP